MKGHGRRTGGRPEHSPDLQVLHAQHRAVLADGIGGLSYVLVAPITDADVNTRTWVFPFPRLWLNFWSQVNEC